MPVYIWKIMLKKPYQRSIVELADLMNWWRGCTNQELLYALKIKHFLKYEHIK